MALFGTGNSAKYWRTPARDFSGIGARPIWVSVWTRGANITTTGGLAAFQNATTLIQSAGPYYSNATISGWDEVDSAGSTDNLTGNVLVANTWQHVLSFYAGAASRAVYFNGVSAASNTTTLSGAQSLNTLAVGVVRNTVLGTTRAVAEVAFGTGFLSADQIKALAAGRSPLVVAPGQILGYFPLRGTLEDLGPARAGLQPIGAPTTAWTDHPSVDLPPRRRLFFVSANSIYNDSVDESGSAAETIAMLASLFNDAGNETGSGSETIASGLIIPQTQGESGTAADALAGGLTIPSSVGEGSASAADASGNSGTLASAVSESTTASVASSTTLISSLTMDELAAISDDAGTSPLVMLSSIDEVGGALEDIFVLSPNSELVNEVGSALDIIVEHLLLTGTVAESGSGSSTLAHVWRTLAAIAENGTASDVQTSTLRMPASTTENGSASDAQSAGVSIPSAVSESGSLADLFAGGLRYDDSIEEDGGGDDELIPSLALAALIAESGALDEQLLHAVALAETIDETHPASDLFALPGVQLPPQALSLDMSLRLITPATVAIRLKR